LLRGTLAVGEEPAPAQAGVSSLCTRRSAWIQHKAWRPTPACARAGRELAGIVADQHGVGQKAVCLDAAPQRPLGGDQHRVRGHPQRRDAEPVEVRLPGGVVGEVLVGMRRQALDDRAGQSLPLRRQGLRPRM
jgi:hypothetical protein